MTSNKIRVLVVDDHTIVREGVRALLEIEPDMAIVGEVADGRQAVKATQKFLPDVTVMDIAMPHLNGIEATAQIKHLGNGCRVILLSMYMDEDYVREAAERGADGFVVKGAPVAELVRAVREVHSGRKYFRPSISSSVMNQVGEIGARGGPHAPLALTQREREVLQLVAEGMGNKEIAHELAISVKTVEKHRQQVMDRLNIHTVAGLTRYAMSKRMVQA